MNEVSNRFSCSLSGVLKGCRTQGGLIRNGVEERVIRHEIREVTEGQTRILKAIVRTLPFPLNETRSPWESLMMYAFREHLATM